MPGQRISSSPGVVPRFWEEGSWDWGCLKTALSLAERTVAEGAGKEKIGRNEDEGLGVEMRFSLISHREKGRASTLTSERTRVDSSLLENKIK